MGWDWGPGRSGGDGGHGGGRNGNRFQSWSGRAGTGIRGGVEWDSSITYEWSGLGIKCARNGMDIG